MLNFYRWREGRSGEREKEFFCILLIFFKDFIYLFLHRGEEREKEREKNISVWLPLTHTPTGDLAYNPGMYPNRESNP